MIVTGSVFYSTSTRTPDSSQTLGLVDHRADLIGGVDWLARPTITLFANAGRTVSRQDPTSAQLLTMFGISLQKSGWTK